MKVMKTLSPSPYQFIRFVKHHPHTFKMTYTANISKRNIAFGSEGGELKSEMFDAQIMSIYGWSDIASKYDIDVVEAGRGHIPDYDGYAQAKDRADLFFSLMQEHIEMLFSPENPPLSF